MTPPADDGAQKCRHCRFWGGDPAAPFMRADCRRNPPVVTAYSDGWPTANSEDWCGAFEQRRADPDACKLYAMEDGYIGCETHGMGWFPRLCAAPDVKCFKGAAAGEMARSLRSPSTETPETET